MRGRCLRAKRPGHVLRCPRNVRSNVSSALETYLLNTQDELDLRVYSTISVLEEQINDTNLPQHARTRLFEFIRDLEGVVRKWETNGGA